MVLRGQGDSPVRICEPCKKLEEAARFELRHGRRPGRGISFSFLMSFKPRVFVRVAFLYFTFITTRLFHTFEYSFQFI